MCQTKTSMCFLFSQPIIGCPLLRGKFCPKCSPGAQKKCLLCITNVHYKGLHHIEVFSWEFDHDSVGSLKKCLQLIGVRYIACPLKTGLTVSTSTMLLVTILSRMVASREGNPSIKSHDSLITWFCVITRPTETI